MQTFAIINLARKAILQTYAIINLHAKLHDHYNLGLHEKCCVVAASAMLCGVLQAGDSGVIRGAP